jgi:hypothetical protein
MNISCFRAEHHSIDFMAADASAVYLATGHGVDVRIWKGDKRRMFSESPLFLHILFTCTCTCCR